LLHATPSVQSVPSVAAAHSAPVSGNIPSWMTPPETPVPHISTSGRTHSASSSVSGVGALRSDSEIRPTTELDPVTESTLLSTKRADQESSAEERPQKKRRLEPTLVSKPEE
jgi:hypothetical protein